MRDSCVAALRADRLLHRLVELESPTGDAMRIGPHRLVPGRRTGGALGGSVETRDGGPCKLASATAVASLGCRPHGHRVAGGTLQRMPFRWRAACAWGPGALDMKGGHRGDVGGDPAGGAAVAAGDRADHGRRGDRQSGRPAGGRGGWRARADAVLVVEPPVRDGTSHERSGLARYQLRVRAGLGRGRRGRRACRRSTELAHQTLAAVAGWVTPSAACGSNVGQVGGGSGEDVVAGEAWARVDVRAWTAGGADGKLEAAIRACGRCWRVRRSRSPAASRVRRWHALARGAPSWPSGLSRSPRGLGQPLEQDTLRGRVGQQLRGGGRRCGARRAGPGRRRRSCRRRARLGELDRAARRACWAL